MNGYRFICEIDVDKLLYKNHLDDPEILQCVQLLEKVENAQQVYKDHLRNILKDLTNDYIVSKLTSSILIKLLENLLDKQFDSRDQLKTELYAELKNNGFFTDIELIETFIEKCYVLTNNSEETETLSNLYQNFREWWRASYDHVGKLCTRGDFVYLVKLSTILKPYIKDYSIQNIKLRSKESDQDSIKVWTPICLQNIDK